MYYALLDMRGSCVAITGLIWGESLKQIADCIIDECDCLIDDIDDMSLEELEEEYYCELDDYKELCECENPTFEMLENFSLVIGDCSTTVGCLVNGYSALVKAFDEYTEDKMTLDEWKLVPEIEETDEKLAILDEEIRSLNEDGFGFGEYEYLLPKYDDDEE